MMDWIFHPCIVGAVFSTPTEIFHWRFQPLPGMSRVDAGTRLDGAEIEVMLAKPADKVRPRYTRMRHADTAAKANTPVSLCTRQLHFFLYVKP